MATPTQKVVKVDDAVIAFPGDMEDEHVARLIKSFREKNKGKRPLLTTAESEHARQLSPAQPLSTAIPKLPSWATTPLLNDKDLEETPQGKAITAKSQEEFTKNHPQISAALAKGNNPYVLGALKGTNEFIKSMSSPVNAALMLGAPESKLLSGFFAVQAMRGSFRDAQSAKKAFEEGKNEEATQYLTQALLGAGIGTLAGAHAAKDIPIPEPVKRFVANEEGTVGPQEGGSERRANPELRKRIDEMTPEEMRKLLKTSDVVDLPNKRSFLEDQHFSPMPFVARSDADGLKAFNDKFGYEKGDELLKAKAEALKEAGLNAYHEKGDEFLYRGKSDKELAGRLEKAREILRNKVFDVTLDDGTHVQLKGVDFSYGTGKDLKEAETRQHAHKAEREAAGQRKRGELVGLTEVGPQTDSQGQGAAQSSAAAPLAEIKKQAETLKPTTAYQAIDQSQPFYLKSENLINEKMKGPMAAEDVHKMLLSNGVKPEEMQWTGLDEFLKAKGKSKVTPQEIQEHLAANNLQIHEVMKGTGGLIFHQSFPTQEALMNVVNGDEMLVDKEGKLRKGLAVEQSQQGWNLYDSSTKENPTKFGSYVLPGGENYRELLLTMPPRRMTFDQWRDMIQARTGDRVPDNEAERKAYQADVDYRALREGADFRSSHWDEPNVLGHIRMNDRTGPNGEKILHIEELQSDLHQSARTQGYRLPSEITSKMDSEYRALVHKNADARTRGEEPNPEDVARAKELEDELIKADKSKIPDAPFKKTWPELMLKRMIQYAAMHGYDGISWTPGEEQANRYDLSRQVDRVAYFPEAGILNASKNGKHVLSEHITPEKLPDFIGKEAAKRLLESPLTEKKSETDYDPHHVLSGEELKVGGEGMKGFYDKIIPDAANKLGKQWGAKVGKIDLDTGKPTSGQGWEQEPMWETIAKDVRLGKMPLYAIFDEGGNWIGTTGDPESGAIHPGEHVVQVADENGHLLKHVALPSKSKSVPYLPLKSKMGIGVKSIPYSLFGVAGAAVGLQAVKQKADELQKKFREAGLSQ